MFFSKTIECDVANFITFHADATVTKPSRFTRSGWLQRFAKSLRRKLENGSFVHMIFKILANENIFSK